MSVNIPHQAKVFLEVPDSPALGEFGSMLEQIVADMLQIDWTQRPTARYLHEQFTSYLAKRASPEKKISSEQHCSFKYRISA